MTGDGDGWVHCSQGHRHWGRFGAAGLLVGDGQRVVLQHRAPWTHEGGTWGLPGGARDSHEDPVAGALREADEEAAILGPSVVPIGYRVDDHGGWSYTTVVATPRKSVRPYAANAESTEVRWWRDEQIAELPLHRGFATSWPRLRRRPAPLVVVIADVPSDDRDAIRGGVVALARHGIASDGLPTGVSAGGLSRLLPHVVLGSHLAPISVPGQSWWSRAIEVRGDLPKGAESEWARAAGTQVVIVSEDAGRGSASVRRAGADWLLAAVCSAQAL